MSQNESGHSTATVSLAELMAGDPAPAADPDLGFTDLIDAIVKGGWPAQQGSGKTEPVLAQVWRSDPRQHRLGRFIATLDVCPFSDWKQVGSLLTGSTSPDFVDAHMVVLAIKLGDSILTGDPDDLNNLTRSLGRIAPVIYEW